MAKSLVIQKLTNFAQNLVDMAKKNNSNKKKAAKTNESSAQKAKTTAKKAVKAKSKPSAKPVAKSSAKPVSKASTKASVKTSAKVAIKPAVKKLVKKAAKVETTKKVTVPVKKSANKKVDNKKQKTVTTVKSAAKVALKNGALNSKQAIKASTGTIEKKGKVTIPVVAPKKEIAKPVKAIAKPLVKETAKVAKVAEKPATQSIVKSTVQKKSVKSNPKSKQDSRKSGKNIQTHDGKRIVRTEMPAKALITIQKPEEEVIVENAHYEFPTLRYSDAELKEFKEIIDKKLAAAREELKNLKDSLESHTESQVGNKSWNMEEGSDTSEMEYLMNQIARLNKFIRDLEMALVRIENKTYGICRATGKLIDKNRLRIVPHATLSMEAKMSRKSDDIQQVTTPSAHMGSEGEGFGGEE